MSHIESTTRSEQALLLAVARTEIVGQPEPVLEAVNAPLDWTAVQSAASHHGLEALLYRHLAELDQHVPPDVREALLARSRSIARRNLYLTAELVKLVSDMADEGIRALPFKGPVAAAHYPTPGLRSFGDLDLLVPEQQRDRAIRALEARSFRPWHASVDSVDYALPFDRDEGGLCVDLHWGFAKSWFGAALDFDRLWKDGERVRLGHRYVRTFSVEDQLLHLCIHGAKHGPWPWPRLKWVLDAGELIRANADRDWAQLVESARSLGCRRMLSLGAILVRDVLGRPLPEALESAARLDAVVGEHVSAVRSGWWTTEPHGMELGERLRFDLATRERRSDRWAYLWRRTVTPERRDLEALSLDERRAFLYRPLRVLRLAARYGLRPGRLKRLLDP